MKEPATFWGEKPDEREARVRRQNEERANCTNDVMELMYSGDLDEVFAELLRLHTIVQDERTQELIDRIFGEASSNARRP